MRKAVMMGMVVVALAVAWPGAPTGGAECPGDVDGDGHVTIAELVQAVNAALTDSCAGGSAPRAELEALLGVWDVTAGTTDRVAFETIEGNQVLGRVLGLYGHPLTAQWHPDHTFTFAIHFAPFHDCTEIIVHAVGAGYIGQWQYFLDDACTDPAPYGPKDAIMMRVL